MMDRCSSYEGLLGLPCLLVELLWFYKVVVSVLVLGAWHCEGFDSQVAQEQQIDTGCYHTGDIVCSSCLSSASRPTSIFGATSHMKPGCSCIILSTFLSLLLRYLCPTSAASSLGFLWRRSWICKLLSALTQLSERTLSSP